MNKLFKLLQESFGNAPQRNGFDPSRRAIFSTKVGYKLPCFALETVPNDYHEIRPVDSIQSEPMNDLNFLRIKQYMDFYFVPMTAIQSNFNEVMQQTTDPVNSLLVDNGANTRFPVFPLCALLMAITYANYVYRRKGDTGLWDRNDFDLFMTEQFAQAGDDFVAVLSNNPEYSSYYDYLKLFCEDFGVGSSRPYNALDMFGQPIYQGAVRLLDLLRYGNYLPLVNIRYGSTDPAAEDYEPNLEYKKQLILMVFFNSLGKGINLNRLGAYQCVHQNYGINTIYDKLDVYSYNFDDVVASPLGFKVRQDVTQTNNQWQKLRCVFTLRYSQWKKDIFTSSYPDSQFGGVSVVSSNYLGVGNVTISGSNKNVYVKTNNVQSSVPQGQAYGADSSGNLFSTFSILDLRRAEALQGWKEDMMRSGFRARQRQKSQFGVAPSFDPHCQPVILGSVSKDIGKDRVVGTSQDNFAELASNGYSSFDGQEVIKFDGLSRNDYGIIIGVMSIVPESDYDSLGIDVHNIKSEAFDYYTPAFQNIGLQSLSSYALNAYYAGITWHGTLRMPSIHGYVPRYSEYKQAHDTVHGEFCSFPVPFEDYDGYLDGVFRSFVSSRVDMETHGLSVLASLYVNPRIADDIFVKNADYEQSSDQFKVNLYCEVKSVRPMSVLGLPRY